MADYSKPWCILLVLAAGILLGVTIFAVISPVILPHTVKEVILTEYAPKPIGPYSQAVYSGQYLFLSGQIGLDPRTGNLSPSVEGQTTQVMENLRAVLSAEGLNFSDVVHTRIFLTNLSDWDTVNAIYGRSFTGEPPARSTVGVSGLPRGAKVEIEMIAFKD